MKTEKIMPESRLLMGNLNSFLANKRELTIGLLVLAITISFLGFVEPAAAAIGPNGKIAYVECYDNSTIPFVPTQCDIWVMNPDGTGQTNLTNSVDINEVNPAWSPDGARIAYFEGYNWNFNLRLMNADGTNPSGPITTTFSYPYGSNPSWSPGGTQIAFMRTYPGTFISEQSDIVVINLTTGIETVISRPVDFGGFLLEADEFEPAWSPDGSKIAFVGVRLETYLDPVSDDPIQGAQNEIVTVNPDGSGEQIVTVGNPGTDRAMFLEDDRAPAWSPDGSKLVFMSQDQIFGCCGPWQIWAVNRDGTGATNLTNDPTSNDMSPTWSPDGTQIVFSRSTGSGGADLYAMSAPTSLPLVAPLQAAKVAGLTQMLAVAPLSTSGLATDPDWGRDSSVPLANQQYSLFVTIEQKGKHVGGKVFSQPKGINCGKDCSEVYKSGTKVELTATPNEEYIFNGWSGACSGKFRKCLVLMNDVKSIKASFARLPSQ